MIFRRLEPFHNLLAVFIVFAERNAEDDSDMLMEPDEFRATAITPQFFHANQFRPFQHEYVHLQRPSGPRARSIDESQSHAAQNYFGPSFYRNTPPLGHSRPYFASHEAGGGRVGVGRSFDQSILGSGDFGVIRGGTFYQEDDPPPRSSYESNEYLGFYNNNGHGRPHDTPFAPKSFYPNEQFANFRDFADINTPTDPAYSQFVVVYANKNSTDSHPNPKNIFEQLELLDKEKKEELRKVKKDGLSKFKKKLASTKLEKKYKKKAVPKENASEIEPLLALS